MNTKIQSFRWTQRLIAGVLTMALAGVPSLAAQNANPATSADERASAAAQGQSPSQTQSQTNDPRFGDTAASQSQSSDPRFGDSTSAMPDPSRGPQQPVQQPEAPTAVTPGDQNLPSTPQPEAAPAPRRYTQQEQPNQEPSGAATAERGSTRGGAASRPAGNAIAPAKQRQVRSLVIKVGVVLAGAAALGAVYGLSKGTSSVPPGARPTAASAAGH